MVVNSRFIKSLQLLCVIGMALLTNNLWAANETNTELSKTTQPANTRLTQEFQSITTLTYRDLTKNAGIFRAQNSLKELQESVASADKNDNSSLAVGLIAANLGLITHNLNADALQFFAKTLLKHHAELLAKELLTIADNNGDSYMVGRINFELAKHYAEQNDWKLATDTLDKIDISNNLISNDADEAFIILGAALQQEKKHRESLAYYNKIKPASTQYRIAQLNTAIAYIRQDWWTDAQLAIDNALAADVKDNDGLTNRLHTVLGFSQLQNGFYRNARESFRNVQVKSDYSNRALLGLGMAALHQEDFIGALNAFNHLKQKDPTDISVMESYLLSAFTLEKLKQQKTATASYSEAINFYEQKHQDYENLRNKLVAQRSNGVIEHHLVEAINKDLHKIQPQLTTLFSQIKIINQLLAYNPSNNQQIALKQLNSRLNDFYVALASDAIQQKINILNSYLSQSRFGLAKLYDAP